MNEGLRTEEFEKKKSYKGLVIVILCVIIIGAISFGIYYMMMHKSEKPKKKVEESTLNKELQDIYGFAISDNYIVALKKNGSLVKIYNLLQGTGNLGDFTYYTYYRDKLYLLFSDDNLYTISLTAGDRVYELTKNMTLERINCLSNQVGKTSDIAFNGSIMYFNNSSCGVSRLVYDTKNKRMQKDVLKTFQNVGVDFEFSNSDKSLYVKADNFIYQFDNNTGEVNTVVQDIHSSEPIILKGTSLVYQNVIDGSKNYYLYNIKNKQVSSIVEGVEDLILYKNSFVYRTNDAIYLLDSKEKKEIYHVHYNQLSDMELVGSNILQIVDQDTTDESKKRIIHINLASNKFNTTQESSLVTNVVEYSK